MQLKQQYIVDIGFQIDDAIPYVNNADAIKRIRNIYQTSRQGGLHNNQVQNIWAYIFEQIYNLPGHIPITIDNYNNFSKEKIKNISVIISNNGQMKLGIAQKIFNLFMKDLWAWNCLTARQEKVLHVPLDRTILSLLNENPWPAWTKITTSTQGYDAEFKTYLSIQKVFRKQLRFLNFDYPLEYDQYLWHGFQ